VLRDRSYPEQSPCAWLLPVLWFRCAVPLFLAGVAPCRCCGFGVLAGCSVGLDRACAVVFGLCRRLFLAGLVAACTTDTRVGPEGVRMGVRGKPRGHHGALGKGAPVVSPAEPEARMLLTGLV
jgi:hypothetical protein